MTETKAPWWKRALKKLKDVAEKVAPILIEWWVQRQAEKEAKKHNNDSTDTR